MPRLTIRELSSTVNDEAAQIATLSAKNRALRRQVADLEVDVPKPREFRGANPQHVFESEECPICMVATETMMEHYVATQPCGHQICRNCQDEYLKTNDKCPICRAPASRNDILASRNKGVAYGMGNLHGQH